MVLINEINELYNSGKLKFLIDSGIVPSSVYLWRNVYNTYKIRLEKSPSKMQAMEDVSLNFEISINYVRKIRRIFEDEQATIFCPSNDRQMTAK